MNPKTEISIMSEQARQHYTAMLNIVLIYITYYINQGYQIVNVSELMEALDMSGVSYFSGK